MFDYYGVYQKIRNASWQCLIDFNVSALPVSSIDIAREANIKVIKNSDAKKLGEVEFGLSVYQPTKNRWAIIYDDTMSPDEYRWCVAHELGHIMLGHELQAANGIYTFEQASVKLEAAADSFALRLLAPSCVLWELDIHGADDISRVCDIPARYAVKRAARMAELYKRNKFLTSPLERKVYENFISWVKLQKPLTKHITL